MASAAAQCFSVVVKATVMCALRRMCTVYNYIIASAMGRWRSLGGWGRFNGGVTARLKVYV